MSTVKCNVCLKTMRKDNVVRHMKIHCNDKTTICEVKKKTKTAENIVKYP